MFQDESKINKRNFKGKSSALNLKNYTIIDNETTGLQPASHEIIELSSIKVRDEQRSRQFSACDKDLTPIKIDKINNIGYFKTYKTTLESCTCRDFVVRRLPCKHMYRLAHELKVFELPREVQSSEIAILANRDKKYKLLDKSTGEIITPPNKEEFFEKLDSLSPASLKTLKDMLYCFIWKRENTYFLLNDSIATEIINTKIVSLIETDILSKLNYANEENLFDIISFIKQKKGLKPQSITMSLEEYMASPNFDLAAEMAEISKHIRVRFIDDNAAETESIREDIKTNYIEELRQLENEIFVFTPEPYLQYDYKAIYIKIFNKYESTLLCYDCYVRENKITTIDPSLYFEENRQGAYCGYCNSVNIIRVLGTQFR